MIETTLLENTQEDVKSNDRVALEYIAEAWAEANADGIESQDIASAAIFAALASLVKTFGEETVADMTSSLGPRIIKGEFTAPPTMQ